MSDTNDPTNDPRPPLSSPEGAALRLRELATVVTDPVAAEIATEVADWLEAVMHKLLIVESEILHLKYAADLRGAA